MNDVMSFAGRTPQSTHVMYEKDDDVYNCERILIFFSTLW